MWRGGVLRQLGVVDRRQMGPALRALPLLFIAMFSFSGCGHGSCAPEIQRLVLFAKASSLRGQLPENEAEALVGQAVPSAVKNLRDCGFDVKQVHFKGRPLLVASLKLRPTLFPLVYRELRVVAEMDKNAITAAKAYIFTHGL